MKNYSTAADTPIINLNAVFGWESWIWKCIRAVPWWHPISIPASNSLLDYFQSKPVDCEINLFCGHHPLATIPFSPLRLYWLIGVLLKFHDINIRSRQNTNIFLLNIPLQNPTDGAGNYQEWVTIIFICLSPPDIKGLMDTDTNIICSIIDSR